jgi:hypothetical protein
MEAKYSLTTLLNDMLKLQNNSYQIISSISDLVSSKSETVEIPILQGDGNIKSVFVPSFGSMKSQIQRLEKDIKSLSGLNDSTASVRLPDGSFRKILVSNLQKEAEDIRSMPIPSAFATKENWFFESFLNPLLYVSFDLTNQVKYNIENVEVSRYILNIDTENKKRVFSEYFLKKSDIAYSDFVKILLNNDIKYFLDRAVTPIPPRSVRYSGKFTITKIDDKSIIDPTTNTKKRVISVKLDKLTYNDSLSSYIGTQSLKIGDSLIVNNERKNTRYEITGIDSSNRSVNLKLIEGYDSLSIGTDVLTFYSIGEAPVKVDINIGFNEYSVIFVKPIDPDSKIASVNWSPGVGLYTNDLTIIENGQEITLSKYYQDKVVDFGSHIYSLAKEGTIPSSLGVTPDSPVLTASEFKVVQINKHSTDKNSINDVRKLHSDKLRLYSDLQNTDKSLNELRIKLQKTRYSSTQAIDADKAKLDTYINEKNKLTKLYSSTIDNINSTSTSFAIDDISSKYRVRGFFPLPIAKSSQRTSAQEVVQFVIQYRYLSKDGSANQPETIDFVDVSGVTRRGSFSTWSETKTPVRRRQTDPVTGNVTWITEAVENSDELNINSIDLPISEGEIVEFRVKSLSEAGWPISPKESDWSEAVRVEFPSALEGQVKISQILQEAREEKVRLQLQNDLSQLGFSRHVSNSFEIGGNYFAHPANEIASGYLTAEQNVISLFDKLREMENEIFRLRGIIEAVRGVLVVKIIDEKGQEYPVNNNGTVELFAGNYRDQVSGLQVSKGVIVSKTYYIKLVNGSSNTLELYSRFWGSRLEKIQSSYGSSPTFSNADSDYNKLRRYDFVPIALANPTTNDINRYGFIRSFPDQSSQVSGQFINCRYYSIDGINKLYSEVSSSTSQVENTYNKYVLKSSTPGFATSTLDLEYSLDLTYQNTIATLTTGDTSKDFVWKGTNSTEVVNIDTIINSSTGPDLYNLNVPVHISHPEIPIWISQGSSTPSYITNAQNSIRNSVLANITADSTGGLLQTPIYYEGTGSTADRYCKIGFEPNDQYLLGPRSVGAYLFLNPKSHTDLVVNGGDSISVRTINFGNASAISIPFTFQYRMTDYYGNGKSGLGNLGGRITPGKNDNLVYTKLLGIDIYSNLVNKERLSFDIKVTARYYSKNTGEFEIPTRTFPSAVDDLTSLLSDDRSRVRTDSNTNSTYVTNISKTRITGGGVDTNYNTY